jgi:hypothetical protein
MPFVRASPDWRHGSCGYLRRAVARWRDGTLGEALRWYADEVMICEGDLVGKTREQLRSLHFPPRPGLASVLAAGQF